MIYKRDFDFSSSSNDSFKPFLILRIISLILLLIILSIVYSTRNSENDKFNYVYYMSKIITIKKIILENHNSEILDDFSPTGEPLALSIGYKNLLKLVKNKNGCISGYRPCGILDTYGNVLCIDEFVDCPVNKIKADHLNKENQYLSKNYKSITLSKMSNNYKIFYSNENTEGNVVVLIIQTKGDPKYITKSNFVLDSEAYEEVFGDGELLKQIADVFGVNEDEEKKYEEEDDEDQVTKLFQKLIGDDDEDDDGDDDIDLIGEAELYIKGAKLLITVLNHQYNKMIEKFEKFVEEKLEILDDENNDLFFNHIGDTFYSKNYIGFKSVEDINKFIKFDFSIYKNAFPSFQSIAYCLAGIILICFLILLFLCCLLLGTNYNYLLSNKLSLLFFSAIFYAIDLGFFIYALVAYSKVNKNKNLGELESIKSDEFINGIIEEFVNECRKNGLIISTIVITIISLIIDIIAMILYFKSKSDD